MAQNTNYTLITGGSGGIGLELAKIFASNGHNLIIVSRDQSNLDTAAATLTSENNIDVITISKDLFRPDSAFELYTQVISKGLEVDILVNDAGQGLFGEFSDTEIQREIDIIQLNIISLVVLTKYFLQDMISKGQGRILNVSSLASKIPGPYQSVYHGTKAFVQSFTESVRSEVKDKGVVVTALLPGATATDFFDKADMLDSKMMQKKMSDAADVAKDGYEALMSNDDKVISGFMNKLQAAMGNLLPDDMVADQTKKQQEPVNK